MPSIERTSVHTWRGIRGTSWHISNLSHMSATHIPCLVDACRGGFSFGLVVRVFIRVHLLQKPSGALACHIEDRECLFLWHLPLCLNRHGKNHLDQLWHWGRRRRWRRLWRWRWRRWRWRWWRCVARSHDHLGRLDQYHCPPQQAPDIYPFVPRPGGVLHARPGAVCILCAE